MKKLLVVMLFTATLLTGKIAIGQMQFALNLTFDYPTMGFDDGKIIPELVGNYPNPVEYLIDLNATSSVYTVLDSLTNLAAIEFTDYITIFVIDTITSDTITGASTFIAISEDISIIWNSFNGPTNNFMCDGNFLGTPSGAVSPIQVQWYEDYTQSGTPVTMPDITDLEMTNLCAGYYTLVVPFNSGPLIFTNVYIEPFTTATSTFNAEVFTSPSSADSCSATAEATVVGGVAPYQYFWDLQAGTDQTDSLCPGIHTLKVIDANSDSCMVIFGVADSTNFWDDTDFFTSFDDTIYFMTEDCGIDYLQPIDSIAITYVDFFNDSTVAMEFTIWQGASIFYVQDTSSYGPPSYGTNLIDLTQFCLNKALGGNVVKYRAKFNYYLSVDEPEKETFSIHPNPSEGLIYIETEVAGQIEIYSLQGSLLLKTEKKSIDLSEFPAGIYQIIVKNESGSIIASEKLVLQ